MLYFLLVALIIVAEANNYLNFLEYNTLPQCAGKPTQPKLPKSYFVTPGYFQSIPINNRIPPVHSGKSPIYVNHCGREVTSAELDAYEFQTEELLTAGGCNIYDGACRAMALALLEKSNLAQNYLSLINGGSTCQFPDVRGDATCKGHVIGGTCTGNCGFCYGDGGKADATLPKPEAWSFRMLSDYWAFEGTVDQRCPEKKLMWTWNDYRPVLGENSWANLLAPLQVAVMTYGSVTTIPDNDISITMALNFFPSLSKMFIPSLGAVYYAPKNTLVYAHKDAGYDVSTENNLSLLAGLKALRYVFVQKNIHGNLIGNLNTWIDGITRYIQSSFSRELNYFRQGGVYNPATGVFTWNTGTGAFAVDCQTWGLSVINPLLVDQWFGPGTALSIWKTTKVLGGYNYNPSTNTADGLGFSENSADQVLSGEWTAGGVNMVRILAQMYPANKNQLLAEATHMKNVVERELKHMVTINGNSSQSLLYANKRYWIPFGWWANPLPSAASTSWGVMLDNNFNPFYLGGEYAVDY